MESKLSRKQVQAWNNFVCALRYHGFSAYCDLQDTRNVIKEDRVKLVCCEGFENLLNGKCNFKKDELFLKSEHIGAFASYREDIETWALQICLIRERDYNAIDVDCDRGRPFWSLKGWLIHGCEVVWHKLTGKKTNPFDVRNAWNKRGYGIPLVNEYAATR